MFTKIMVPLDGSELAECVLPHVEAFISGCQVKTIVFVRVIDPTPMAVRGSYVTSKEDLERIEASTKRVEEERKLAAAEYLRQVVSQLKQERVELETEVIIGKAADSLVDYTEGNNIDLILIATHGRSGVSRWVRGSIADRILRAAEVPILMVRAPGTFRESKR
jgi:nucleotide-binding universal stress UspA family protein